MPGPALTPIASPLPAASAKGPEGTRPDAAAQAREADAPETGFAGELQRHMQGSGGKDEGSATQADAPSPDDGSPPAADAAPQPSALPPELVALLAGLATPPAGKAAAPVEADAGEDPATTPAGIDSRQGLTGLGADPGTAGGRLPPGAAADLRQAADLAGATADAAGKHPGPAALETAIAPRDGRIELAADAAPGNSFAAIHAAALANLRGESSAAAAPLPIHVATPAGSPAWPEEVGNRVSWMVRQHESQAELTLTPPQLGRIEVSITVSGDQTSAQFVTATPAARELIEQSLPRLREILEQSGISLGQADVGTSGQRGEGGQHTPRGRFGGDTSAASTGAPALWQRRGEGLVDTFA